MSCMLRSVARHQCDECGEGIARGVVRGVVRGVARGVVKGLGECNQFQCRGREDQSVRSRFST